MFTDPQSSAAAAPESATLKKFMFERSFDPAVVRVPERKPVTLKPDQYDALKQESYDQGFAAGHKAGQDEQNDRLMRLLQTVADKIDQIVQSMHVVHGHNEANVRKLAVAMVRKILPDLAAKHGLQEIEAMLDACIGDMVHEPRLVVRVNDAQFDTLNERIAAIAEQKAYSGKVVVLADAGIALGDCRIEWADGGLERNTKETVAHLEKTVLP